jgi:hypothetical protein
MEQCRLMAKSAARSPLEIGMDAFAKNVAARMEALEIEDDRKLFQMVKQRSRQAGPSEKTVNNAVNARHDAKISTLNSIAEALEVPLWVLLIPGLDKHPDLLRGEGLKRLVRLVENYMTCDDGRRSEAEVVAHAGAILKRSSGK